MNVRRLITPAVAISFAVGCLAASACSANAELAGASAPVNGPPATHASVAATHAAGQRALDAVGKTTASVLGVVTDSTFTEFDKAAHVHVDLEARYLPWGTALPAQFLTSLESARVLPLIEIEPRGVTLTAIADGRRDSYLKSLAGEAKSLKGRLSVSFAPEMNGNWYSWGGNPSLFVRAWRHVVTVFRDAKASNVSWVWIVHHVKPREAAQMRSYWPGASWVTWVGLDGYYDRSPETFTSIFSASITEMRKITKDPVLITETAVGQIAKPAPAKIANLFDGIRTYRLLGLVWFDIRQNDPPVHQNWNLESRPAALRAFRAAAKRVFPKLAG